MIHCRPVIFKTNHKLTFSIKNARVTYVNIYNPGDILFFFLRKCFLNQQNDALVQILGFIKVFPKWRIAIFNQIVRKYSDNT